MQTQNLLPPIRKPPLTLTELAEKYHATNVATDDLDNMVTVDYVNRFAHIRPPIRIGDAGPHFAYPDIRIPAMRTADPAIDFRIPQPYNREAEVMMDIARYHMEAVDRDLGAATLRRNGTATTGQFTMGTVEPIVGHWLFPGASGNNGTRVSCYTKPSYEVIRNMEELLGFKYEQV